MRRPRGRPRGGRGAAGPPRRDALAADRDPPRGRRAPRAPALRSPPRRLLRVVVTGPESTGKTTLARILAGRFDTTWAPEAARGYLTCLGRPPSLPDIEAIARLQLESEEAAARDARGLLVCDTDLLATRVWSEHYFGVCPGWVAEEAARRPYDLHLLCRADVPWVDDGLRDSPGLGPRFEDAFRRALREAGRPFVERSGSWPEREDRAVAAILALGLPPLRQARPREG
ncbi:ATP-binding protein [Acidobacteria bacterium ACD]|nr:ATP-binding protein [Acidobacteria bacterium ACD]